MGCTESLFALNDRRRRWERRGQWLRNPVLGMLIAFALGAGLVNLPNQGAILVLALGGLALIGAIGFAVIRWIMLRSLSRKITRHPH